MNRTVVSPVLSLIVLIGLIQLASADSPVLIPTLLTSPDQYGEKEVLIRGTLVKKARAAFPNGRRYSTLLVGDGQRAITVFSWEDPPVETGDSVEVSGAFHIWRYNLRHMIESRRIIRSGPPTRPPRTPRAGAR